MSIFASLGQIQDAATREALKEVARRIAAIEPVNPSQVTPTLASNLSIGDQRLTNVADPTHAKDLVNLSTLRGHVNARVNDLLRSLRGITSPADTGSPPPTL